MEKDKKDIDLDRIFIEKRLIEAAAQSNYEIKDDETMNMLVFIANQCLPEVFSTIIKEYKQRG